MRVALVGATGKAGGRLVAELRSRGHDVTGIARQLPEGDLAIPMRIADATDEVALTKAISSHDALISAARFVSVDAGTILRAMQGAGLNRILVVGGAGTLFVAPGVQLLDSPTLPDAFKPEVHAGRDFLEALRASEVDWTFLSPAANFGPGERTGRYRLGGDTLLRDANGESRISYEDLAWALVDELEKPHHSRERFSIAY